MTEEEVRFDFMSALFEMDLQHLLLQILGQLSALDLRCCQLVSSSWSFYVQLLFERQQRKLLGSGWLKGQPLVTSLQCEKQRSVCTVSSISVDEEGLVVGLGSSGDLELWNRRSNQRIWRCHAHQDGIYGVDMNKEIVASAGDDALVKIFNR